MESSDRIIIDLTNRTEIVFKKSRINEMKEKNERKFSYHPKKLNLQIIIRPTKKQVIPMMIRF